MEDGRQGMSDNISEASSADREHARALAAAAAAAAVTTSADEHKSTTPSNSDHFLSAFHSNGLQQHEHEARVEALQVIHSVYYRFSADSALRHCARFHQLV